MHGRALNNNRVRERFKEVNCVEIASLRREKERTMNDRSELLCHHGALLRQRRYCILTTSQGDMRCLWLVIVLLSLLVKETLAAVYLAAPENLCIDAGPQENEKLGSLIGGEYSGPGATDNGDGLTFTFDPFVVGSGTHTITYPKIGDSIPCHR